ncbi:MAG TPA: type II toxin-antitoxin system VapC family toxin [Pirellulales bacterium]|jgi:tRNA(fMet)-specific endonuclease VapC|nr:type II toxin-antitoxin system VapC family toxin [Pirellulales bacterium]
MFLLDTDHIVVIQQRAEPEFNRLSIRMSGRSGDEFFVPIITFHEQVQGWNAYISRAKTSAGLVKGYARLERILSDFSQASITPFDEAAAARCDSLRKQRVRIGTMDLRIAAIALVHGYTLLSRNSVDFQKVPGLAVEDWTRP